MNHILHLHSQPFIVQQCKEKILLSSLPDFQVLHKLYAKITFTALNSSTFELLSVDRNTVTVFRLSLSPLKYLEHQQSFIDWEAQGGLILKAYIILYDKHSINFYMRGSSPQAALEKAWEIDIVQEICSIKHNLNEETIGMTVRSPSHTIFLWNMNELNLKPTQEIILSAEILQWEFRGSRLLSVLTSQELLLFFMAEDKTFTLQHFYQLKGFKTFCWLGPLHETTSDRRSVNSIALLSDKSDASLFELLEI